MSSSTCSRRIPCRACEVTCKTAILVICRRQQNCSWCVKAMATPMLWTRQALRIIDRFAREASATFVEVIKHCNLAVSSILRLFARHGQIVCTRPKVSLYSGRALQAAKNGSKRWSVKNTAYCQQLLQQPKVPFQLTFSLIERFMLPQALLTSIE